MISRTVGICKVPVDAIKGLPWWAWVLAGLAVLYLFNMASGSICSRKLWNMLHDQIIQEDKAIQEELEKEVTRLDQREKELIQENARIKKQLAAAHDEKRMPLGRLHEIETQLNAVASTLPPSTDLNGLAERFNGKSNEDLSPASLELTEYSERAIFVCRRNTDKQKGFCGS